MKKTFILTTLLTSVFVVTLTACGPGPQSGGQQDGQRVEMKLDIPKHQLEALENARGVEQALEESDQRRREALRE